MSTHNISYGTSASISALSASVAPAQTAQLLVGFEGSSPLGSLSRHPLAPAAIHSIHLTKRKPKVFVGSAFDVVDVHAGLSGVSASHFTLDANDDGVKLTDHSLNGTFVNHLKVHHSDVLLLHGNSVSVEEGLVHHWVFRSSGTANLFELIPIPVLAENKESEATTVIKPKSKPKSHHLKRLGGYERYKDGSRPNF
ncbi:hypothetical protein BCR33DRAFT_787898 [Rhizoclosmatium globosum]|uniref:FHA domain-containing protein n=1 Tax=Rhizoclosmatium globosum TaxID=329046 RepID=A0A1Y2BYX1_9FUNG|nr:hypothetical protein BCR33DRAFT_787898 [Rhizoclosmatium globosum]|eukprot:ORY39936.1 hypothetical protein BCR33DRAFT_787898 [Rhizoclosmatium globosum]